MKWNREKGKSIKQEREREREEFCTAIHAVRVERRMAREA